MAVREIITFPENVLRRRARKVLDFGAGLQLLIDDMIDTMRAAPGVGLAAPQVGEPVRVIVVEYAEEGDAEKETPPKLYVVVNPEISRNSIETEKGVEGCLSVPGFAGEIERSLEVIVKGQNRRGQTTKIKAKGWLARVFQHEMDHIDGVLYTDKAEKVWKLEEQPTQLISAD